MAAAAFPLACLNDANYLVWSVRMEAYLRGEGLWEITDHPPADMDLEEERLNERAQASIILCLEDSQLLHVRGLTSANECWTALRQLYVRDSVVSKISLARRLFRTRLLPGASMAEHLQLMRHTFMELEETGVQFSELHKVFIILSSLDESYSDSLVSSLESFPERQLTLAYLNRCLLEEEQKRSDNWLMGGKKASTPPAPGAAASKEVGAPGVHGVRHCYKCGSETHLQRSCPSQEFVTPGRKPQRRRGGWGLQEQPHLGGRHGN